MTTWKDYPDTSTPITAAALNDLESRADLALSTANSATENLNATTENLTTRTSALEARPIVQAGHIENVTGIAAGATATYPIVFTESFTANPAIAITTANSQYLPSVTNVTATGFTMVLRNVTSTAGTGTWAFWTATEQTQ